MAIIIIYYIRVYGVLHIELTRVFEKLNELWVGLMMIVICATYAAGMAMKIAIMCLKFMSCINWI